MPETSPLVSIVIPAYRRADFLNQAIDSVLTQTLADYELIVVDDCSGEEIVRQYRLPPGARLIVRAENSGRASVPRNDGLRAARGRYVAFMDMDDIWAPEKLAEQAAVLEAHPEVGLTFCHYTIVDEALRPRKRQPRPTRLGRDILRQLLAANVIHTPSQVLIRRSVLEEVGGFDDAIFCSADWDLWTRLARVTAFHADARPLMLYRCSAGQQSRNKLRMYQGAIMAREKALDWVARERPDLLPVLRRRLAYLYCRYARWQLRSGEALSAVSRSLSIARTLNPLNWRAYDGLLQCRWHAMCRLLRRPEQPASLKRKRSPDGENMLPR